MRVPRVGSSEAGVSLPKDDDANSPQLSAAGRSESGTSSLDRSNEPSGNIDSDNAMSLEVFSSLINCLTGRNPTFREAAVSQLPGISAHLSVDQAQELANRLTEKWGFMNRISLLLSHPAKLFAYGLHWLLPIDFARIIVGPCPDLYSEERAEQIDAIDALVMIIPALSQGSRSDIAIHVARQMRLQSIVGRYTIQLLASNIGLIPESAYPEISKSVFELLVKNYIISLELDAIRILSVTIGDSPESDRINYAMYLSRMLRSSENQWWVQEAVMQAIIDIIPLLPEGDYLSTFISDTTDALNNSLHGALRGNIDNRLHAIRVLDRIAFLCPKGSLLKILDLINRSAIWNLSDRPRISLSTPYHKLRRVGLEVLADNLHVLPEKDRDEIVKNVAGSDGYYGMLFDPLYLPVQEEAMWFLVKVVPMLSNSDRVKIARSIAEKIEGYLPFREGRFPSLKNAVSVLEKIIPFLPEDDRGRIAHTVALKVYDGDIREIHDAMSSLERIIPLLPKDDCGSIAEKISWAFTKKYTRPFTWSKEGMRFLAKSAPLLPTNSLVEIARKLSYYLGRLNSTYTILEFVPFFAQIISPLPQKERGEIVHDLLHGLHMNVRRYEVRQSLNQHLDSGKALSGGGRGEEEAPGADGGWVQPGALDLSAVAARPTGPSVDRHYSRSSQYRFRKGMGTYSVSSHVARSAAVRIAAR